MTTLGLIQIEDAYFDQQLSQYGFGGDRHMGQSAWIVPVLIDIINYCETNNQSDVAETLADALEKIAPGMTERPARDAHFQDD